ncbi:MAG: TetR/AcrR family transcriptional regulator [Deltaproteobacteria bacterium]|nr:TetR/AcrR family transcriptional regulator [Deltaproteobacteria bacterium]MBW2324697.1 TetR/AcrR family transcriptional regulator [Deltaproteobacteria bacterium]
MTLGSKSRSALIIKSAKKLFTQYGFNKTSLGDIAKALNLTKASLYHYFSGKEDIFINVIRVEIKELFLKLLLIKNNISSVEDRFKKTIVAHLIEWRSFPLLKDLFAQPPRGQNALIAELRQEIINKEADLIEEIFIEGQREGHFDIANPKVLAQTVVASIRGIEMSSDFFDSKAAPNQFIDEFVRVMLKGITSDKMVAVNGES